MASDSGRRQRPTLVRGFHRRLLTVIAALAVISQLVSAVSGVRDIGAWTPPLVKAVGSTNFMVVGVVVCVVVALALRAAGPMTPAWLEGFGWVALLLIPSVVIYTQIQNAGAPAHKATHDTATVQAPAGDKPGKSVARTKPAHPATHHAAAKQATASTGTAHKQRQVGSSPSNAPATTTATSPSSDTTESATDDTIADNNSTSHTTASPPAHHTTSSANTTTATHVEGGTDSAPGKSVTLEGGSDEKEPSTKVEGG